MDIFPKNDEYFSEYAKKIDLKKLQILVVQQVLQLF